MAGPVATLLVALGLDGTKFEAGLSNAQKVAAGFGANTKTQLAVVGVASGIAAAGLGLAAKAGLQAQEAQGKFMAATGASREEAKAFVSEMDSLAGSAGAAGMSFEGIAAAGTMVEQQFGTTGDATRDLTSDILDFAKVTGSNAEQAAGGLEDTLSAFGLTADDAAGFMDKLVYSTQTFGTDSGPEAIDAVRQMAPALQAMNMGLDDGIAALNLFEVAGIDATTGQMAFNKAVDDVPPGGNFDDIIAKLGAIEDPAMRDAEAVKIFGERAGHKMALAIKPGMKSLDDFRVSMDDAKDATHNASEGMLTDADKIRGIFDKLSAGIREFGQDLGPALAGLGGIASALGPLAPKLGKAITAMIPKLIGSGTLLGAAIGQAQAIAQQAAATGSAAVKALAAKIAAMAIPLAPAGTTVGTAVGAAMSAGVLVGFAGVGLIIADQMDQHQDEIVDSLYGKGTALRDAGKSWAFWFNEGLGYGMSEAEAAAYADRGVSMVSNISGPAARQAAVDGGFLVGTDFLESLGTKIVDGSATVAANIATGFNLNVKPAASGAGTSTGTALATHMNTALDENLDLASPVDEALGNVASTIRGSHDLISTAMDDLAYVMTHPLEVAAAKAELIGQLTGQQLRDGLASKDATIHAQAVYTYNTLTAQWFKLTGAAWNASTDAVAMLERGLRTFNSPSFNVKWPTIPTRWRGTNKQLPEFAAGGDLRPGEWGIVGENGPELERGGTGGTHVYSNPESMGMMNRLGLNARSAVQAVYNFHFHGNFFGNQQGLDALAEALTNRSRQKARGSSF